jgi:hypothetical protein
MSKEKPVEFPGSMKFQLKAGMSNQNEGIHCFNTAADVTPDLPFAARGNDFEPLESGYDLQALRKDFSTVSSGIVSESSIQIIKR